jgi:hypothetical protein
VPFTPFTSKVATTHLVGMGNLSITLPRVMTFDFEAVIFTRMRAA